MKAAALAVGILLAVIGQYAALAMVGGGHGWLAPASFSPVMFFTYPFILFRMADTAGTRIRGEIAVVATALILDALFLVMFEAGHFPRAMRIMPEFALTWIALWSSWQLLAALLLWTRLGRRRQSEQTGG